MDLRSWLSTVKGTTTPGKQGQSAKALADLTKDRIRSAANAFFTNLWRLEGPRSRGAPTIESKQREAARDKLVERCVSEYDIEQAPKLEGGVAVKEAMREQVEVWWNQSETAEAMRQENSWGTDGTVEVQGRRKSSKAVGGSAASATCVHEDTERAPAENDVSEAETVRYGYRDPSLDLLRRAYLHLWSTKGEHVGWTNHGQHTQKCQASLVDPLPERTFYRWLNLEKEAFSRPVGTDDELDFLKRPIRHQSQISGMQAQLAADRAFAQGTRQTKEPELKTVRGCPFLFHPVWYPDLIQLCNESLDSLAFGPDMVLSFAAEIYASKMNIPQEEALMYTPSMKQRARTHAR